ncbi:MAG: tetratricopeptide repeat protein [Patescibacteria group bacterium]
MPPTNIVINMMPRETPPSVPVSAPPAQLSQSLIVRIADGIAHWALISFCALFPVFLLPYPWAAVAPSKVILATAVAVIVILAWMIARLFEGTLRTPKAMLLYAGLLLPLAYVISTAAAGWNTFSLVGHGIEQDTLAAVVLWYALFALSACVFATHRSALRVCVRALCIGLTALFVLETLYIFFPTQFSLGILRGVTANPFGSWHDLGIVAGLGLFLSVALFRSGVFLGLWRVVPVVLGLLSLFILLVVHFQDVFWGVAALSLVGLVAVVRAALQAEGMTLTNAVARGIPWLIVGVAMVLLGFFSPQLAEQFPERIRISEVEVRPSWQGTFDVARNSLDAPTSLIFGSGPNSFIREWGLHKPQGVNLTPFWNSDFNFGVGVIPTSVFAVGLFGLVAWAALLIVLLGLLFRFVREVRPLTTSRTLFGVLLVAVIYATVFHMIYTPGVALTGLTFLLLGLLAVAGTGDTPPRVVRLGIGSVAHIIALIIFLTFCAVVLTAAGFAGREVVSNLFVNRGAYAYQSAGDVAVAGQMIERALALSPSNDRAHRAATELGIVELGQLLAEGSQDEVARTRLQETLQETIQHGLSAVSIDSGNYQNWLSLAQLYSNLAGANVEGALENAKSAYEKALGTQPTNPVPKFRLAQLAVAKGDVAGARTYLQEAIALKPDFAAAYYLLSQVEAAAGQGDPAVQAAAQAVQLVPDDPLGWFNLGYILYSGGVYADAALALERAASLTPDYANALFILGLSYNGLGRTNDAVLVLRRVAELNPNEAWLQNLIANVEAGKAPFEGIQQQQ